MLKPLLAASVSLSPLYTHAFQGEEQQVDDLFVMPLSQLLTVNIATKEEQAIQQAPALISIINMDEYARLGLKTLSEVLNLVPGIDVSPTASGNDHVQIRGLSDQFNQKILFLLDGIPYWMPANGDIPFNSVPLSSIEKIEIIRGPGSVLYGTNASAGVINIITKKDESRFVQLEAGNHAFYRGELKLHHKFESFSANLSLSRQDYDGEELRVENSNGLFDFSCNCSPANVDGEIKQYEDYHNALLNIDFSQLSLTLQHHKVSRPYPPDASVLHQAERIEKGTLIGANYRFKTKRVEHNLYFDWNRHFQKLEVEGINMLFGIEGDGEISFDNNGDDNTRTRFGINSRYTIDTYWKLTAGLETERRSTENQRFIRYQNPEILTNFGFSLDTDGSLILIKATDLDEHSLYSQISYESKKINAYLGARLVENSQYGDYFNPSASLVNLINEQNSIKLVYAKGFSSPTFRQSASVDFLGRPTGEDIEPESVESFDLVYDFSTPKLHLVANAYHIKTDNLIESADGTFNNQKGVKRSGIEADITYKYRSIHLTSNVSYLKQGNQDIDGDISAKFSSRWLSRTGFRYTIGASTLGISYLYGSRRATAPSYDIYNLNYRYRFKQGHIELSWKNLLSDDVIYPDVRVNNPILIHGSPANRVILTLRQSF